MRDRYFFTLKGKTLYVTFDGPYLNDKTPTPETKKWEREILATFSVLPEATHCIKMSPCQG